MATYYVKNGGNDLADGLSDATAFATVNKALSVKIPGDIIELKRGSKFYEELNLGSNATALNPIWIRSYGDNNLPKPEITGLKQLSSWVSIGGGLYECQDASISERMNFLVINNSQQKHGKWPKLNYNQATGGTGSETGTITDSVNLTGKNFVGGELVLRKKHWIIDRGNITSHSGSTLSFIGMGGDSVPADWGYFVQNIRSVCTDFGDWCQEGNKIIMFFGSDNPADYTVQVPVLKSFINTIKGGSHIHFEGIRISGYNGKTNTSGNMFGSTVYFEDSPGHKFHACDIQFHQVFLYHYGSPDLEVLGCNIRDINDIFWFSRFEQGGYNLNCINNTIQNIGMIPGASGNGDGRGIGMNVSGSNDNVNVIGNRFINIGYNGLGIGGYHYLVKNNYFDNCCAIKDDGGCIYTFKGFNARDYIMGNRIIEDNICIDSPGAPEGTWSHFQDPNYKGEGNGIYIDDNAVPNSPDNIIIRRNTAINCAHGLFLHNNQGIQATFNLLINNHRSQFLSGDDNISPLANRDIIFTNNILYATGITQRVMDITTQDNNPELIGTLDFNYYMRPSNENNIIRVRKLASGATENYSLSGWKSTGYGHDANSLGTPTTSAVYEIAVNDTLGHIVYPLERIRLDPDGLQVNEPFGLGAFAAKLLLDDLGPTVPVPVEERYINVNVVGSGVVSGAGAYEDGEEVTLSATANSGWSFLHWSDVDGVYLDNPLIFIAEENRDLDAIFDQDEPIPGVIIVKGKFRIV